MLFARMSYARLAVIGVSGLVFIAAIMLTGVLFGQQAASPFTESSANQPAQSQQPATPSPEAGSDPASPDQAAQEEFVEFRDEEAGFAISYPARWGPRSPADSQVRFLASSTDGNNSALVRVTPFDLEEQLGQLQEQTDEEVDQLDLNVSITEPRIRDGENVDELLLGPRIVEFAGDRASYYVYTFNTADGERSGVHAQYFLFQQDRMITLVLQAIPPERFSELASTFDRIAQSFELLPGGSSGAAGSPAPPGS